MAKRGKVKATELKNVRVDFVSLVTEGANAERFAIYKSAEGKKKEKTEKRNAVKIDKKDIGVFERILNFLKGKSNEEEIEMGKADEILKAVEDLSKKVISLTERVDKVEKGDEDEPNPDDGDGDGDGKGKGSETADDADKGEKGKGAAGDDAEKEKKNKAAREKAAKITEKDKSEKEVLDAITKVRTAVEEIIKRVEKIEKARGGSNQITKDKKNKDKDGNEIVSFENVIPTGGPKANDSNDDE